MLTLKTGQPRDDGEGESNLFRDGIVNVSLYNINVNKLQLSIEENISDPKETPFLVYD